MLSGPIASCHAGAHASLELRVRKTDPGPIGAFANAKTDPSEQPQRAVRRSVPREDDEDQPSLGEVLRALHYVENKADAALKEIHGSGRDPGIRGMLVQLQTTVGGLDEDLGAQKREIMEALNSLEDRVAKGVQKQFSDVLVKIEEKRMSPFVQFVLTMCAIVVALASGYSALLK